MKKTILLGRGINSFFLLLMLFIGTCQLVKAQGYQNSVPPGTLNCAESAALPLGCDELFSHSVDQTYLDSFEPVVFNIHFWRIVNDDGSSDPDHVTEEDGLTAISMINRILNPYNIFFKFRGFKDIPISDIYIPNSPSVLANYISNYSGPIEVVRSDCFNMYIPYDFVQQFGGSGTLFGTRSIIKSELFATWGMVHELGHNLGLVHTFQFFDGTLEDCEHVTRLETDPNYNADTHGDRVPDTAATLILRAFNTNEQTCDYEDNDQDCEATPYQILDEDVRNYMNYVPEVVACEKLFTVGQAIRMREAIDINCYNKYQFAITSIASLYEPYQGVYPSYYPHPQPWELPLFQPGFEYRFVSCECEEQSDCTQPVPWEDINSFTYTNNSILTIPADETNYSSIIHPNHSAIQLEGIPLTSQNTQSVRRCYDNYNSPPVIIGGTVILFNDGVFNNNITSTPQDSIAINNPSLINDLDQGLYKIEKNYNNGETEETILLKEND